MRIVMIGNCQVEALVHLYRQFAAKSRNESITYIRSYEDISAQDRQVIEAAEVIVEQVQDFRPKGDIAGIATSAERVGVPVVHGGFLWPFAGQPHPQNPGPPFRAAGPYGSESSDGYLNRLIKKGLSADAALNAYRALDVNATVNLDRLLELSLERQAARDELTGFQIAPVIAAHFRQEQVFLTPYHPNLRVALALAAQFFAKMGVDPDDIARLRRSVRITPFPKDELPVHPQVARHFGLHWAGDDRVYRFLEEGRFTFDEFVRRYIGCVWNEALDAGLDAAAKGETDRALTLLTQGLADSPGSARGHAALSEVLDRLARPAEALQAARQAAALEPEDAGYRLALALQLARHGEAVPAERELRIAAALDPFNPHFPGMLANRLAQEGALEEAAAVAAHGLVLSPYAINLHLELAGARARLGDHEAAAASFRQATRLDPDNAGAWTALIETLERAGRHTESLDVVRAALQRRPGDPWLEARMSADGPAPAPRPVAAPPAEPLDTQAADAQACSAVLQGLIQTGAWDDAEIAARLAIRRFPKLVWFRRDLAQILERRGALEAAVEAIEQACAIDPGDLTMLALLGDILARLGRLDQAAEVFRLVIGFDADNAHVHGQLGDVLSRQGQHEDAIAMRRRAMELDPGNAHRRTQLGHSLLAAGKLAEAEHEIRTAIAEAPQIAGFHLDLSHVLSRADRLPEAIEAVRQAVALQPLDAGAHTQLGALLEQADLLQAAETAYREALAHAPDDAHTLLLLSKLLSRRGGLAEARAMAEAAQQAEPGNADARRQLQSLAEAAVA